jgi:hypothetical protein
VVHKRLTIVELEEQNQARNARIDKASVIIINQCKLSREGMLKYINDLGICIDPASKYDDIQLQQIVTYWHLLEPDKQKMLAGSKPVIFLYISEDVITQNKSSGATVVKTLGEGKGGTDLSYLQEGTVNPVIQIYGKMPLKLGVSMNNDETKAIITTKLKLSDEYDPAWAFIVYFKNSLKGVSKEAKGLDNLQGVFTLAHEFTHVEQILVPSLYCYESQMVEPRIRFYMRANRVDQPIFCTSPGEKEGIRSRSILGDKKLKRSEEDQESWRFLDSKILKPSNPSNIPACFKLYDQGLKSYEMLLTENGVKAKQFFVNLSSDFRSVLTILGNSVKPQAPATDFEEFIPAFLKLQKYLGGNLDILNEIAGIDRHPKLSYKKGESLIDAILELLKMDTTLNEDEHTRFVEEMVALLETGIRAVNEAMLLFRAKVVRSIAVQQQTCQLFPQLIGHFSGYSNSFFADAVKQTKQRLGQTILTCSGQVFNALPKSVMNTILQINENLLKTKQDLSVIPDIKWYELGAPLGFFNVYTQEYDAETHATWVCWPLELFEMYRRAGWNVEDETLMEQILNQATYVSTRGIMDTDAIFHYEDPKGQK